MRIKTKMTLVGALSALAVLGAASSASAETRWEYHHPRRDQVVDRLQNQNRRIAEERREGDLSFAQAHRLRVADRVIFRQEQFDARLNGGHITRAEQRRLNREENAVSRRIGR
ncbi:MAG: hypothetical protein JSS00_14640 [Proteobacteria bacterium]|nr:hypothetical protein [Pseudomonadota bacterium]